MTTKINRKEDIINFVQKLNNEIKEFIRNSLESSTNYEKWSSLPNGFKQLRCWEIKGCTKKDCLAYGSADYRCWLKVGTLCGGKPQGEFAKKYKTCFDCDVFKMISKEPLKALYENVNTLIFHLNDKSVKLGELAIKDQLTKLYNRHFFNEIIEKETARCERKTEPLSFIMIDIDGFKQINDTFGHLTGDKLLAEAATLIKNTVRKSDIVFRYGGDEFLVILTNSACDTAVGMVQRILDGVEDWNKNSANAFGCKLSFSVGCSTYEKGSDVLDTLKEADDKMYQNKREKRNNWEAYMKTNKYFQTLLVVLCAAAFFASGCREKAIGPVEKMTLAIPTHLAATPAYVAFSKGFFKENGLDVILQKHTAGKFCLDAVLEGKADMAVVAEFPFMNAVMNGKDVGIVATIATTEGHLGVAGRKDRGISRPEDLRNKKIGVTYGTNHVYFLHMFLVSKGINDEQIKTVNLRPEQMSDALKNGEVDAVCTQRQILKKVQKEMGDKAELFSSRLYLETFNVVGTKDFIKKNPEAIKKLLRALIRAEEFVRKNPEESKETMAKGIDIDKAVISEMWASYRFDISLKHYLLNVLEAQSRWMIKGRLVDRKKIPNYLDNIYIDGLRAVQPESVSLRGTEAGAAHKEDTR